jgi:hypothetical protein
MATLIKGLNAIGRVLEVNEGIDSFKDTKSEQGGMRYCHGCTIMVDDIEYPCQYCSTSEHLTEFSVGDIIDFNVKSFSRNVHTIGINSVKPFVASRPAQPSGSIPPASKHINMAGTPEALGLQFAAQVYSNRLEIDSVAITDLAHEFTMYLRTEYEINTNPNY